MASTQTQLSASNQKTAVQANSAQPAGSLEQAIDFSVEAAELTSQKSAAIAHGPTLQIPPGSPTTFTQIIHRATQQHPTREIVFIKPDGSEHIQTYATLKTQAERLLAGLRSLSLQPGDLVILYAVDRDFIAAFWACIIGGFVPVPLTPNPKRQAETEAKLKHAWNTLKQPLILASASLLTDKTLDVSSTEISGSTVSGSTVSGSTATIATIDDLSTHEPAHDWHPSQPADLAYLVMSSGTTGTPKVVEMSHHIVTTRFIRGYQRKLDLTRENILLNWLPFSHSAGLQVVRPQWDRVIYVQTEAVLQNPLLWLDTIEQYGVTNVTLPNFALGLIVEKLALAAENGEGKSWKLSHLRRIGVSTEAIVPKTARLFAEQLFPYGLKPNALCPTYSMSEVGAITSANRWSATDIQEGDRLVVVGEPDQGCSIRIVNEHQQLLSEGETGQIQAYSPAMSPGYYRDPDRTAGVFTADGWFKTGDLGFLQQGQLTVTGRHKELIIINGRNYHSTEIEAVVEGIDGLEKGYTAACATRSSNNNTDELVLFFHPRTSDSATLSDRIKQIRKILNQSLGVNPAYLLPVDKETIPRTATGKIQRLALKKRFDAGEFSGLVSQMEQLTQQQQQETFVAPQSKTEQQLADIWATLLKRPQVGTHDNFFELGGHSLMATQVVSRIRQHTQLDLPLHSLFAHPTVAELASFIDQQLEHPNENVTAIPQREHTSEAAPLSFAQERLWFAQQLDKQNRAYHLTKTLKLQGTLDVPSLQQALSALVARHESLRTRFIPDAEGMPTQVIASSCDVALPLVDLTNELSLEASDIARTNGEATGSSTALKSEQALQKELAKTTEPFNLATDLMLRAKLFRLQPDAHVLHITIHHIAADGWSMGIFKHELSALYQAFAAGQPSPLSTLPIQYADFAHWQRQWLAGDRINTQLTYWKQQLAAAPPVLALPTDYPRPAQPSAAGASITFALASEVSDKLKTISQQNGATLYMTLLAAFNTLLARYSQQDDIVIGSPIASRDRPELENLIGFFVNTLVLRTDLSGEPTFQTLLQRVRQTTLDAYAHQNIPFEELVAALKPERSPNQSPWFQVMFVFQNQPLRSLTLPGLTIETFKRDGKALPKADRKQGNAMFDLTLFMRETEDGLSGKIVFKTDLFDSATIHRMAGHFQTLLTGIATNPQKPISQLPLLTPTEQQQLTERQQAQAIEPINYCIHQLFEAQVERTPDAIALIDPKTEQAPLTYQALNAQANRLARHLQSLGVGPDVLVGLCVERAIEMVVGLLGILKAGGAYVPLDPAYPKARLTAMVDDAQPKVIVTLRSLQNELPTLSCPVVCLDRDWHEIEQSVAQPLQQIVQPNHLAYIIYTSGSTGKPKGVMIEHRSLVNFTRGAIGEYGISENDRILQFASINFDAAAEEIFPALCTGATLILRTDEMLASPQHFMQQCQALQLTVLDLPTAYWHQLTAELANSQIAIPAALRLVIVGGEAAATEQLNNWQTWLSQTHQPPQLINTYGPTESTIVATAYRVPTNHNSPTLSIGQRFANAQIHLLDTHQQPVPIGLPGEIHIGGPGLARGSLNCPALTAESFITSPFASTKHPTETQTTEEQPARLYKTGDLACYLPDGNLKFLGRRDGQIKIRGFRIELGEIESALTQHPAVQQCIVIASEATGDKRLIAYVVTTENQTPAALNQALKQHLQQKVPAYMVPAAIIGLTSLPLTPNGKVNRKALPEPDFSDLQSNTHFVAPRTPQEQNIADIWAQVLKLEQVSIHDSFFELGGHSLLAIQVTTRVSQALETEIPLQLLFTTPTLEKYAAKCAMHAQLSDRTLSTTVIHPTDRQQPIPASFAQQRMWFLQQLEPDNSAYKISRTLRLKGKLNVEALQQTFATLLARHEVLRTRLVTAQPGSEAAREGIPVQAIAPPTPFSLPLIHTDENTLHTQLQQAARRPFNLAEDLMLRANLFRLGENEHVLQVVFHHIAADGWSIGLFRRELGTLYNAYCQGKTNPLPTLPIQYTDFAAWQRQWLTGNVLATQLTYWQQQLAGAPPLLELPTDHPRPPHPSHRGAKHAFTLSKSLTESLSQLSQQHNTTLFMTLLSAFKVLLFRYTQQTVIVIGSPIANRPRPELENLIGLFLNTLVLRTDLTGSPTFLQLLSRVKTMTLDAYAHQDLPFEKLLETLKPTRNLSHSPWFQVMFILQASGKNTTQSDHSLNHSLNGLETHTEQGKGTTAKFDLTLTMRDRPDGLRGTFEYSLDLFEPATIERMVGHFQTLLESIATAPDTPITTLSILPTAERQKLLPQRALTSQQTHSDRTCIHRLIDAQVQKTPNAIALTYQTQTLTYQQLNHRANQLAHHLQSQGVGPDSIVGICTPRSLDTYVGLLAILKAGGAYLPLDPTYPPERRALMLEDAQPQLIVTLETAQQSLPKSNIATVCIDTDWPTIALQSTENPISPVQAKHLAYIIYTSGSTGKPKGVMIEHQALVNFTNAAIEKYEIEESDGILQFASLNFDAAAEEIFPALCTGATLIPRTDEMLASPQHFMQQCQALNLTVLDLPTAYWHQLAATLPTTTCALPPSLRLIIIGGEAAQPDQLINWQRWVAQSTPTNPPTIINTYGPTEATVVATTYPLPKTATTEIPIGQSLPHVQTYLLDPQQQPVPIGIPGELYIGGSALARGYLNRPDLTAERFIANPFSPSSERLYKTGDLACYLPSGDLKFLGRCDNQVKIRGFRIELGEVETALGQHPTIQQCAVIVRADIPGDKRLVAYIVPAPSDNAPYNKPHSKQLRQFLAQQLPSYMVPSVFVQLSALPLTPSNKVNRQALPKPDTADIRAAAPFIAPRNPTETQLATVWKEILHLETISITDNFFELGGHSLLAAQVVARIQSHCHVTLPLAAVFEFPTIEALAQQYTIEPPPVKESSTDDIAKGTAQKTSYSLTTNPLVLLKQGNPNQLPLFLIHDADGDISLYGNLAAHLPGDRTLYALQPRSAPGVPILYSRIEAIAADYLQQIKTVQPEGPYLLGGLCIGGRFAFEIALQLQEAGEPVALVAMIDAIAKGAKKKKAHKTKTVRANSQKEKISAALKKLKHKPTTVFTLSKTVAKKLKSRTLYETGRKQKYWQAKLFRKLYDGKTQPLPAFFQTLTVRKILEFAVKDYYPRAKFTGHTLLVKASFGMTPEKPAYADMYQDPQFGWGNWASNPIETHQVSGGHNTLLGAEKINELIGILEPAIAKATAPYSKSDSLNDES